MIYYHLCVYLPVIRQQQQTSWLFIIFGNFENKAAYEHSGTSPYRHIFSFLLDKNLQGGISGSHNRLVFTFLRNSQTVFQTICIILCSYQQCRRIPVALHLLYRLVLSFWASAVAQIVNNLSVMQETQVRFLAWGDPVGKEMATPFCNFSLLLLGEINGQRSLMVHTLWSHRVGNNWVTNTHCLFN